MTQETGGVYVYLRFPSFSANEVRTSPDDSLHIKDALAAMHEQPAREYRDGSEPGDFDDLSEEAISAKNVDEILRNLRRSVDEQTGTQITETKNKS